MLSYKDNAFSPALFAGRLNLARSETPGWGVPDLSLASFAARLTGFPRKKDNPPANPAGLACCYPKPGISCRAIFTRAANRAALLLLWLRVRCRTWAFVSAHLSSGRPLVTC